jgi:hypothetical protein
MSYAFSRASGRVLTYQSTNDTNPPTTELTGSQARSRQLAGSRRTVRSRAGQSPADVGRYGRAIDAPSLRNRARTVDPARLSQRDAAAASSRSCWNK